MSPTTSLAMPTMLAQALPTNAVDPLLLYELLKVLAWVAGIGCALVALVITIATFVRRRPSLDVELAKLEARMEAVESDVQSVSDKLTSIDRRLVEGASIHAELKAHQATNSQRIADTAANVVLLSQRMESVPRQLAELVAVLTSKRPATTK